MGVRILNRQRVLLKPGKSEQYVVYDTETSNLYGIYPSQDAARLVQHKLNQPHGYDKYSVVRPWFAPFKAQKQLRAKGVRW